MAVPRATQLAIVVTLSEHLSSLNLSQYLQRLYENQVTELSQLLAIPEGEMEAKFAALGLLKGHAIKLKLSLINKSKLSAPPNFGPVQTYSSQYQPPQQTHVASTPASSYSQAAYSPAKPAAVLPLKEIPLVKEADKIAGRLRDIETLRTGIVQAKDVILNLDVSGYRKTLDTLAALQDSLRVAAEVQAEAATAEIGEDAEKKNDDVVMNE